MCLVANIHRDPKARAFRVDDFMSGGRKDPTEEELEARIHAALGTSP